jgi:hypothetical protein
VAVETCSPADAAFDRQMIVNGHIVRPPRQCAVIVNGEALRGSLLTASDVIRCVKDCVTAAVATAPPVAVSAVVLPRQPDMVVGQLPEETPVPAGRPWRPRQCLVLDAECRADNPTPAGDRLRDLLTAQLVPSPFAPFGISLFYVGLRGLASWHVLQREMQTGECAVFVRRQRSYPI